MTKKPPRARTARREQAQKARKLVHQLDRLAELAVGGSEERPIEVTSAAVIEPRARSTPCPLCAGELDLVEHAALRGLRPVQVKCRQCHTARTLWFKLVTPQAN